MGFLLGGLLEGLGAAASNIATDKRNAAMENLKRQQDLQDYATKRADKQTDDEGDFKDKVSLLKYAGEAKRLEGETDFQYKARLLALGNQFDLGKITATEQARTAGQIQLAGVNFKYDKALKGEEARLRQIGDRDSLILADQIKNGNGEVVGTSPEGYAVIKLGNNALITTHTKLDKVGKGDEGSSGGSIAAARVGRGGTPAVPVVNTAPAKPAAMSSASANRAMTLYANATPATAPGLFRDGNKIPYAEYLQAIGS